MKYVGAYASHTNPKKRNKMTKRKPPRKVDHSKHHNIQRDLVSRIREYGKYYVKQNLDYSKDGYVGEVDVLARIQATDQYRFYEIKTTYSSKSFKKAKLQFRKYCNAYPDREVKGIYVTPQKICRLR